MEAYKLDQTDIGILYYLQRDGLMTYKELAHKLNKTITPIVERTKRLTDQGYIKGTVVILDINKVKSLFIAFPHIQLNSHSQETIKKFQIEMIRYPQVMECYHLTGHYDFMLKIVMPDMASYNDFLRNTLDKLPYVGNIQSFLVLSQAKHETAYPL